MHRVRISLAAALAATLAPWVTAHAGSTSVALGGNQSAVVNVGGCSVATSITETPVQTSPVGARAVTTLTATVQFTSCPQDVAVGYVIVRLTGADSCTGSSGIPWAQCTIDNPLPGEYVMEWQAGFAGANGQLWPVCSPSGQFFSDTVCTSTLQTMVYPADPCARISCTVTVAAAADRRTT